MYIGHPETQQHPEVKASSPTTRNFARGNTRQDTRPPWIGHQPLRKPCEVQPLLGVIVRLQSENLEHVFDLWVMMVRLQLTALLLRLI